ncbi:hypothetical protein predicted by Glimmer/Critica [Acetobacter senegalensis]|uniref:Uncharacterized protein n=1 Tax=Acetobacter senegalensis TaxID=446692 RepID=A0A0U5FRK2_9PROT|nr:hypothetical protein predicted by Glimmer/Critica [Acetobacter senegalensis]
MRHFLPYISGQHLAYSERCWIERATFCPKDRTSSGTFRDYDPGYVHIDMKHLPKLQTADGER